jgi:adenosylcobinamide-phosphate synthase
MSIRARRSAALVGAVLLDVASGEPPNRLHPVVGIGRALAFGHDRFRRAPRHLQLAAGAATVAAVTVGAAVAGRKLERHLPAPLLALALKPTFSLRPLIREGLGVAEALERDDLPGARLKLRALVSRETDDLGPSMLAAAAIESLAENLSDSVVAPWLAYAGFGLAGAAAYRAINTADAMYGYRGDLEWLGKPAARADDAVNWLPSRATSMALVAAATLTHGPGTGGRAFECWRSDGSGTASPNAGGPMAAMAGALGRRLEKAGHYVLGGDFPEPEPSDIRRAARLVEAASALTGVVVLASLMVRS